MMGKAKLTKVSVDIKTPFLSVKGDWEADESEQQAAWELYVELVTRIAVVEAKGSYGKPSHLCIRSSVNRDRSSENTVQGSRSLRVRGPFPSALSRSPSSTPRSGPSSQGGIPC